MPKPIVIEIKSTDQTKNSLISDIVRRAEEVLGNEETYAG